MSEVAPIDAVYTWVDDAWPGFLDLRDRHVSGRHDRNRNRTRDNLDVLRYSLRSLCTYAPWVRHVYVLTMRPQLPAWLDVKHPRLRIVHHDEVMGAEHLPTFNSFAILSYLHELKDLSERFIYLSDDFLLGAPVARRDLVGDDQPDPMYFESRHSPPVAWMDRDDKSPWDAARAYTNKLLDEAFGPARRLDVGHVPTVYRRSVWGEMIARWSEEFERTRRSRFRARYNVVPEFMYPHYVIQQGLGYAVPRQLAERAMHYVAVDNLMLKARFNTWNLTRRSAKFYVLNDDFGDTPQASAVAHWRAFLQRRYPVPCEFER